ncbi:protein kinase domain-containing protein [Planosporangium sp. 12N6]|uniref:protein kinase domain-containing protein n=1 Tax=Planosporangium spinosum TaxID=3402278 RepID=UPI003CF0D014
MTANGTRLLDLVCGPAGPLPETHQRYRLVAHLGSGGQADVYRAVRLCGGVSSAPLTVKVFRVDPRRPLVDELRSWDKGDAALMDLNNRGVPAICRRADGFYGPPPHRPGEVSDDGDAVPYQVYDYLHGINLRQYVVDRAGLESGARRLNAVTALATLAGVLRALHHPQEPGATPVLHMDIKPSNVMVLATGEVKLIDFTGARYWRPEEITQIAYTPESGGPEAFAGVSQMGPAYDVHGFGAVAYFLVTGEYPREPGRQSSAGEESPPAWSVLRRHQVLEQVPALRDHLHQILADRPADRPTTLELPGWTERLAELVRRSGTPDVGVDWGESETARVIGRARPRPPVAGTETDAFQRIEKLERELVELRAALAAPDDLATRVAAPAVTGTGAAPGLATRVAAPAVTGTGAAPGLATRVAAPAVTGTGAAPTSPVSPAGPAQIRGRASVPPPKRVDPTETLLSADPEPADWPQRPREAPGMLKRGWELSGVGAFFAFICWGIWAASARGNLAGPLLAFSLVLVVAAGVFAVARLLGRLILVQRLGRVRRSAKGAHAVTGLFLVAAGVAYLQQTPWVMQLYRWLSGTA